jgi:nucleoside-diphosphate-sugar epimerase
MDILFTGGSSFTGYWFIRELASQGHNVVAVFRRKPDEYGDDIRRQRIEALSSVCEQHFGISFGDDRFLELFDNRQVQLLCCHGAEVTNYNKPDFDVYGATAANTYRLPVVAERLARFGCKVILTGSVFENDEGAGSRDLGAFSPYGLSKGFTWQLFRYQASVHGLSLGKFVIANPFGPYEEKRFTHYVMKCWSAQEPATVNTPNYVRDNIHVSLLARAYARFAASLPPGMSRINPSGYAETQGAFVRRLAAEITKRLPWKCDYILRNQTEYPEPRARINLDFCDAASLDWNETAAWDDFAAYYSTLFRSA